MWHVYIVKCKDGSLYAGSTTDVSRRIKEHNSGKGGSYTQTRRPVRLAHLEKYPNRSLAQAREAEIKRLSRKQKLALIKGGL